MIKIFQMKIYIILPLILMLNSLFGQLPETDIFICNIKKDSTGYTFSKPENITNRPGYDNQPFFTPSGNRLLYVSVVDSSQSDIYSYDIAAKVSQQFTETKESEYSPAFTPDNKFVSVVRVDADSGQRLYRLPINNLKSAEIVSNTDSIGYSCWLNDSNVAMFILGKANTLQVLDTKHFKRKLIASDIGRCMKLSPDRKKMYFIVKSNPEEWFIYSMDCSGYALHRITVTLPNCEDFAILPDGKLIMGYTGKLYSFSPESGWTMIADFTSELQDFYRVSVNNDGTMLALVAFTGKKP
jgi:Tol biopolymer transport system component